MTNSGPESFASNMETTCHSCKFVSFIPFKMFLFFGFWRHFSIEAFRLQKCKSPKQVLLLTPLSNGIHSVNSIEDFDSLWDLWTLLLLL